VDNHSDRIEKRIELKAPISRVWRALTDYQEFGEWFRVKIDGPFAPGQITHGQITYPGYEHLRWEAIVQKMEHERLFSFTWHPYAINPKQDYSGEHPLWSNSNLRKPLLVRCCNLRSRASIKFPRTAGVRRFV
jgi:uncharacterized protein YndB with AHSA1/START domain